MKPFFLTLVAFAISQVVFAQTNKSPNTISENGLTSVVFETSEGVVTTYLPANLHSGDIISGTVITEPNGKNTKQITKNQKILNGYVIEMKDEKTLVDKQKLNWQLPADFTEGMVRLILRDTNGRELGVADLPVNSEPRISMVGLPVIRNDFRIPGLLRSGETEMISGVFDGRADNTGLKLGDEDVDIIAESPEGLFVKVPENVTGSNILQLSEGEMQLEEEVHVADLNLSADKLTLAKGGQTKVNIKVSGLQNIEKPVDVQVTNLSPSVITIDGGNTQTLQINPDQVAPDGTFTSDLNVKALLSGGFSLMAKIDQPAPSFIKILSPANSEEVTPGSLDIKWEVFGMPPSVYYQVKVYDLGEEYTIENQEKLYSMRPVFVKENLQTTSFFSEELNRTVAAEGNYAVAIDAFDGNTGEGLTSGHAPFYLIRTPKCRCTSTYGNKVFANVLKNNQVIGFVELGSQPSLIELPEGPLTLRFTGTDINCGECNNVECEVSNVVYVPALLVINPNETRQTVEVQVTWTCEAEGCEAVECSDTYKFKFKQAKDDCYCGDISLDVEVVNVNAKDPLNQNTRSTVSLHRTAGSSGQEIINMSDGLRFDNKDIIEIRISNISTKCWCESGVCDPTASDDKDERAGRPHTVGLGENDADASNDNCNLVRVKDDNAGWQTNGDYVIKARIDNAGLLVREIYQDFKIRYWCESDDCTKSLCDKNFRLVFGRF